MRRMFAAAVLGLLLVGNVGVSAVRAESQEDMAAMVTSAKSAADHEALAASYTKMAEETKAEIAMHEKMLAGYQKIVTGKVLGTFENHCHTIIAGLKKQESAYEAMAAAHRDLAKKAPH